MTITFCCSTLFTSYSILSVFIGTWVDAQLCVYLKQLPWFATCTLCSRSLAGNAGRVADEFNWRYERWLRKYYIGLSIWRKFSYRYFESSLVITWKLSTWIFIFNACQRNLKSWSQRNITVAHKHSNLRWGWEEVWNINYASGFGKWTSCLCLGRKSFD
jgi:hypothetical protein